MGTKESVLKWQKDHPDRANNKARKWRTNLKLKMLDIIGKSCVCCGVSEWWNLSIDHIEPVKGKKEHTTF